jgi:outer membrane protein assembly factor BamB
MVFRPSSGPAQIVVLGSTRLDTYDLSTGEPIWWMPLGSSGSMGTAVAGGDTIYVSTIGSTEPSLPTFDSVLEKLDQNKDRRLSNAEFLGDKEMGEHFGWIDIDGDGVITDAEWNTTRNLGLGETGLIAVRPGAARGRLEPSAVVWRLQKNLPYVPAPLLYRDVIYLVKDGGIITTVDPATGRMIKEGRSPRAPGTYYASPVAVEDKVFVANTEGQITVLKAAGAWDVLGVNDLGEQVHATPALSDGRVYVRTRTAVYCFGAK